ncbi:MAG: Dabb family protein [Thermomicrobiales bacterium]|nr:Dabb family protein [Thermomicrobiales bacterium]
MLYHMVLLRPRAGIDPSELDRLHAAVVGLGERIPGIAGISWGPNVSPEGLGQGYTVGFIVRFADAAARDAYLPHPDHVAVVPLVQAAAESVLVFDLDE